MSAAASVFAPARTRPRNLRGRRATSVILGGFSLLWFGWAQSSPPHWLVAPLGVGSGLSVLVAVAGAIATARTPGPFPAMADPQVARRYWVNVGIESALAAAGAVALAVAGQTDWIGVWICAVVGAHFLPMAAALADRSLVWLGMVLLAVAAAACGVAAVSAVAPITVAGAGAGLALVGFAIFDLLVRAEAG